MTERRRWGKNGVRLTDAEASALDHRAAIRQSQVDARLTEAHADWERGRVVPWLITSALNRRTLYGPEVDAACGIEEPGIDLWEAGKLYPTWEQLLKLAALTGFHPGFFMSDSRKSPLLAIDTTMRFHRRLDPERQPVMVFDPQAVANTVHGQGACPMCRHVPATD